MLKTKIIYLASQNTPSYLLMLLLLLLLTFFIAPRPEGSCRRRRLKRRWRRLPKRWRRHLNASIVVDDVVVVVVILRRDGVGLALQDSRLWRRLKNIKNMKRLSLSVKFELSWPIISKSKTIQFLGGHHSSVDSSLPTILWCSNSKHTIYAFRVKFCTIFVIVLRNGRK